MRLVAAFEIFAAGVEMMIAAENAADDTVSSHAVLGGVARTIVVATALQPARLLKPVLQMAAWKPPLRGQLREVLRCREFQQWPKKLPLEDRPPAPRSSGLP